MTPEKRHRLVTIAALALGIWGIVGIGFVSQEWLAREEATRSLPSSRRLVGLQAEAIEATNLGLEVPLRFKPLRRGVLPMPAGQFPDLEDIVPPAPAPGFPKLRLDPNYDVWPLPKPQPGKDPSR